MTRRFRTILTQVGSFILAGLLLFLALRGLDPAELVAALRGANYLWLIPLVAVVLLSHWLRAWRWTLLIDGLRTPDRKPTPVRTTAAFGAIMIGYMVNYAAPRLGEIVRTANLATRTKLSFSGLFGTVVAERILDVIVLGLGLLSAVFLMRRQADALYELLVAPVSDVGTLPILLIALGSLVLLAAIAFLFRSYVRASERAGAIWRQRVRPAAVSFRAGLLSIVRSRNRTGIALSTVAIWFCYALAAHLPFVLLGLDRTYQISLVDSWSIMLLGAIGVALPSPGGTGTYHFITILVLTTFFGMMRPPAAAYAVLTHGAQLILYAIAGFITLLVQGVSLRSVARTARTQTDPRGEKDAGRTAATASQP